MYLPTHFDESRPQVMHQLIRRHPLGMLVTQGAHGLDANHLPFGLDTAGEGEGVLYAHVARANPLWRGVADGDQVLVVFRAADAYVSPNWYPSKQETGRQVVARLTRTHEAAQPSPWKMGDSAPDYIDALLEAVVGVEIRITRLEGKSKLGQDEALRDARDD